MVRLAAAALAAVMSLLVVPAVPAWAARHVCDLQTQAKAPVTGKAVPAEDQLYAPQTLGTLATGVGVRVAVLDSGVDASVPQLRGRVEAGKDFLHHDADARQDCLGHGTAVAGIIVGGRNAANGFRGLAPGATIVPVRVSEQEADEDANRDSSDDHVSFTDFARAIDWAVGPGRAQVINMSLVTAEDDPRVRAAVARAVDAGVVVVAAAGNLSGNDDPATVPFPADYPGVIGVGAITASGVRASFSKQGSYVDVMAAGDQVTVPSLGGGLHLDQGTSFAAPFVAATAALIKQRFPGADGAEVARRIEATADPSPDSGGTAGRSDAYGFGLLNPYRALTETLASGTVASPAAQTVRAEDPAAVALAARREHSRRMALSVAVAGMAAIVLIAAAAVIVRSGRRRGWRPATTAASSDPR
jgi:type VII secretion-associated serine protease mycosin